MWTQDEEARYPDGAISTAAAVLMVSDSDEFEHLFHAHHPELHLHRLTRRSFIGSSWLFVQEKFMQSREQLTQFQRVLVDLPGVNSQHPSRSDKRRYQRLLALLQFTWFLPVLIFGRAVHTGWELLL
eukprot:132099-Amphidinium_carterae.1